MTADDLHVKLAELADALEAELHALARWSEHRPPPEAFENMGAFGQRTLPFEQWIQFVLIRRLREIVDERGELPSGSNVAAYAVRAMDGDEDADRLIVLLRALDDLVAGAAEGPGPNAAAPEPDTIRLGDTHLPAVIYTLIDALPQLEGEGLEDQLRTYDTFLHVLSPAVRPELSALLAKAAAATTDPASRGRIERAARDIAAGGHAGGD